MNRPTSGCSVLVIDDDDMLVTLLEHKLGLQGVAVSSAGDGEEGLAQAQAHTPDLIILDGMMPGMDGLEVLRHLKEHESTRNTPVVMLSARRLEKDVVGGLKLGAEDYLTKPFRPEELILKIKRLLGDTWPGD